MTEPQVRDLARRSLQQLIMMAVEIILSDRLIRLDTWRQHAELENFQSFLKLLLAKNQSLIMVTGHYGNWEILGNVSATLGFPTTAVARGAWTTLTSTSGITRACAPPAQPQYHR